MLTDEEIAALFRDMESDRVERKASFENKKDEIRQAICAFANDLPNHNRPGIIFIGQTDKGGDAALEITDQLLLSLGGMRSDGAILPFPVMSVGRYQIDGITVAAAVVAPSTQPPVRLNGRTWIRVGPRRALATVEEERRLTEKQVWLNVQFDRRPVPETTLEDLDLTRFELEYLPSATSPEVRRENGRSAEEKLRALRLVNPEGQPTAAALLLFGIDPRSHLPGAYVQFLRVNGPSLDDAIMSHKEISGTVPDQLRQIEELVRLNLASSAQIGNGARTDSVEYPITALEQIIRNALLHRNYDGSTAPVKVYWYQDRIEIMSPGGLFGEVTPETIWLHATSYRNPLLAEGLKVLGVVERFGYGLVHAQKALEANGNPPLESEFVDNFVLFRVKPKP